MPFPDLEDRIAQVRRRVGQDVTIIAVTKTYGPDAVEAAWRSGLKDVGENRVQEAVAKMAATQVPVRWHLIGHVQTNKVKAVDGFALVHSVDSARLADALNDFGVARGRAVDALLQVNTSGEVSKYGWAPEDLRAEAERLVERPGVRVRGIMTMAPLDAPVDVLRATFRGAREALAAVRDAGHPATELSMGMSNDFEVAVEEGATMVRLGTILFGARAQ
ncbi:MAG TPA: YggS family pyridoxal phosphate-dependent enzyme [Gemmatimonadaceae bacterium]|nr:YggS family pyridoxal phosphate-dependent enzyme [Gemmatimonadaceae bacterium]